MATNPLPHSVRLDKWLWAARFFKTRSLAARAIDDGKVRRERQALKTSHAVSIGAVYVVETPGGKQEIQVTGLSEKRGSATDAAALYLETESSLAIRQQEAERRRLAPEPTAEFHERPTKRDRRRLDKLSFD